MEATGLDGVMGADMKIIRRGALLCCFMLLSSVSFGAAIEYDHLKWVEHEGVIRSIDWSTRTAVISGYRYTFGHSSGLDQPPVELLQTRRGVYEMLQVGMKVQFHFVVVPGTYRRVLYLRQLRDDAWLDNDELPDAHPPLR